MNRKPKIYIGIDPDLKKSGFAIWYKDSKTLDLNLYTFPEVVAWLNYYSKNYLAEDVEIIVEAGWLNKKSNFHGGKNQAAAERIAKNVGENHATGKLIVEFCEALRLKHKIVKPTQAKTLPDQFKKITGIATKNQELIDAGMLVYGY